MREMTTYKERRKKETKQSRQVSGNNKILLCVKEHASKRQHAAGDE